MDFQEFRCHAQGTDIYGRHFVPHIVKGVVVLVHGLGEHSGRYDQSVIPMLLKASLAILTYDNVGHGKSSGKRGHCRSYDSVLDILGQLIGKAEALHPNAPLFLYGHSMGGNLVLNYVLRRQCSIVGIIATSPYLRLAFQPPKWKMVLGKLFLRLAPSITLPSGLDPNGISRIPEEVEKYKRDPSIHDKVSPMFSFPVIDAGEWAIANARKLEVETLLLHGTADPIIDYKGTEEFSQKSHMAQLQLFEGGFHELHHDVCKDEVLGVIKSWLSKRV